MNSFWQKNRPILGQPLSLTFALTLAILFALISGLAGVRTVRQWREEIIDRNMALTAQASRDLAASAGDYFCGLPRAGSSADPAGHEAADLQLSLLATQVFTLSTGLKGGFWVISENEFMGYANPWSPPPAPAYGPPPRSHTLILEQVRETIRTKQPIVQLHQFESMSVSGPVFPLATEPILCDGSVVGVVWSRIHIERELPATRLGQYLNATALVAMIAFLLALVTALHQWREIRSLNASLQLIEEDPSHRLAIRRGMFGSIRLAINKMVDSLETEFTRSRSLEEKLHQQDKMAALGQLLAGVAHEVNTPLAILKTRIQIWQRDMNRFTAETGQPPPLTGESMEMVLNEINRLSDLLRKLLHFSRPIRADKMEPLAADDLIRHTVLFIKPRLLEKRIDLTLDFNAPDATIHGDADALHQVFLNILTNAVGILGKEGRITVTTRLTEESGELVVDLEDSGPGLNQEDRIKVFTPFFTTRHGGSGLGLSIAFEIIRAHKGRIEFVEPHKLGGAHCRVTLPLITPGTEES